MFKKQEHKDWLDQELMRSGAILFRGFELSSARDVSILESLGYDEFPYITGGGVAVRRRVYGRVLTANEYPLHEYIGFHNEAAYLQKSPAKIFLFCDQAPVAGSGGATPIVPGHVVYRRVAEDDKLASVLLDKGPLFLTSVLSQEKWRKKFKTDDPDVAQSRAENALQKFVGWLHGGSMKVSTGALPELFRPDGAGRMSIFGSVG